MKTMRNMLLECNIAIVLSVLTGGTSKGSFMGLSCVYYSLYRYILENWFPDENDKVILASYQKVEGCVKPYTYAFFYEAEEVGPVDFEEAVDYNYDIVVPDCFIDATSTEWIVAAFLYQFKSFWVDVYPNYDINDKLLCDIKEKHKSSVIPYSSVEKILFKLIHAIDHQLLQNEIAVIHEEEGIVIGWDELFTSEDVCVMELERSILPDDKKLEKILQAKVLKTEIPPEYAYYVEMDLNNPPSVLRGVRIKRRLKRYFKELNIEQYRDTVKDGLRIIVENNELKPNFPFIYVCDKYGQKTDINKIKLGKIVCMDIHLDTSTTLLPEEILGKIMFYLEYPLRTDRIIKEKLGWSLTGMLKQHIIDENVS